MTSLISSVFAIHLGVTLCMTGVIWFVQIVHYPLFALVGTKHFSTYEQQHQTLTTFVVAPLMLIELPTAIVLVCFATSSSSLTLFGIALALLAAIWLSTFLVQTRLHAKLTKQFDEKLHHQLVRGNWGRTIAWTTRAVILLVIAQQSLATH